MQTAGLSMGFLAGAAAAKAVTAAAISLGLTTTPVGWVIAIGIGATYLAASTMDSFGQKVAESIYDRDTSLFNRIPASL
ncbi:hypothetical protein GCM10007414_38920 [Agarivorans gilvus]|uniref:Uncharacterized protein n=1 Tax=Agarivorans gilvus TaxID=680279 RepID=A0ABQ1I6P0_9ALTE|nr:hypothetical protein GCM10007414_38920 [Agarivorans gilvus]